MEIVTYDALKGFYGGPCAKQVNLPKGVKLLVNKGDIGSGCHDSHDHYITALRKSEYSESDIEYLSDLNDMNVCEIDDLYFLVFKNYRFLDTPELYNNYVEFMKEFDLSNLYITHKMHDQYPEDIMSKFVAGQINSDELLKHREEGTLIRAIKILKFRGPCAIECFVAVNYSDITKRPCYHMGVENYEITELDVNLLTDDKYRTIFSRDSLDFDKAKDAVLARLSEKVY